ncbi:NAD(P)/FAD-dependent oxidoreductase [Mesorhizobium kowhaii]|uniref:NAD(P)/FAD-dependent oxidoreductase n=1 Tax=Mesorhizobium kowhaii TaxID=1300272 RepID=UPI0035E646AE
MGSFRKALTDVTLFPYWLDNPLDPAPLDHLVGRADAELLIVGGGFTGLWTSILAKQADPNRDVVIIEAGKVGHGASGRPGGIVSTSVMHGLSNAKRIFPTDLTALEKLGKINLDGWAKTIADNGIDADVEWSGEMTVAVASSHLEGLREEFELAQEYGHDAVLLGRDDTRKQLNSPTFEGAVWARDRSGTVHPAKLAWGLKRLARQLGVRIYEHTRMIKVEDVGSALEIVTAEGRIKAPKVLFATNAWSAGHKNIRRRVITSRDRVLATEPLTNEQMSRIGWENRQGVYDTRTQLNYMRLTKDNRIVYGGHVDYHFNNNVDPPQALQIENYERLAGYFFKTFPQLGDIKFTHAWSGPIDLTMRLAVHFQRYYGGKGLYVGGYTGFGVTASRFGAAMGLDLIDGKDNPSLELDFARTMPNWVPPEPARWIGAKLTMYALNDVDEKGGWRKAWIGLCQRLGFPI